MNRFIKSAKNVRNTLMSAAAGAFLTVTTSLNSFAANTSWDEIKMSTDAQNGNINPISGMGKVLGMILTILQFGGVILAAYGVYEFVMGLTQEGQADKKMKGVLWVAGGVLLVALKFILQMFGIIA